MTVTQLSGAAILWWPVVGAPLSMALAGQECGVAACLNKQSLARIDNDAREI